MMIQEAATHIPVLTEQVLEYLEIRPRGTYVDCTVGMGGHSEAILGQLEEQGRLIGLDRDRESLALARQRLESTNAQFSLHQENFKNLPLVLHNLDTPAVDGVLVDLGVSRYQLTSPERGFTLAEDGPLDMRMDRDQPTTAEQLVNQLPQEELFSLLREFGEEPAARKIAAAIVAARQEEKIRTTSRLVAIVERAKGGRRGRLHPATLTFQALRIAVNQELEDLDRFLKNTIDLLKPGGRLVAISFHSLEDRIVKKTFQLEAGRCICFKPIDLCSCPRVKRVDILTKKPIQADSREKQENPSARSAKLRAVERIEESHQERRKP